MTGYAAVDYKLLGFKLSSLIVTLVKSRGSGCGRCHDVMHMCINNTYSIFTIFIYRLW